MPLGDDARGKWTDRGESIVRVPAMVRHFQSRRETVLVLSRKALESIVIGDDITITILEVRDGKVRIGIEAPRDVAVHRLEVWVRIQEEDRRDAA